MRRALARSAPPQVSKLVARTNQPSNGPSAYADGGVVKDVGVRPPNDGQAAADDARPRPPEDATAAAVHVGVGRDRRVPSCGMSCVGMYVCMYVDPSPAPRARSVYAPSAPPSAATSPSPSPSPPRARASGGIACIRLAKFPLKSAFGSAARRKDACSARNFLGCFSLYQTREAVLLLRVLRDHLCQLVPRSEGS